MNESMNEWAKFSVPVPTEGAALPKTTGCSQDYLMKCLVCSHMEEMYIMPS